MKVTVHCEGTAKEIAEQLKAAASVYETGEEKSAVSIADIKAARGKGKKGKTEEVEEELLEEEELEEEELEEEELEEVEEAEAISEKDLAKLKAALKAYSDKHDKKKAIGILKKFAEKSDLVKPSDLPKVLKALKV